MKQLVFSFCVLAVLILSALCIDVKPMDMSSLTSSDITVSVRGAVNEEQEVTLPLYSTMQDLLDRVSLDEKADLSTINPSTILTDQDVVTIPFAKEEGEEERISINTADAETLSTLPGIGPSTAQKIISYRETEGLFQTIEDLMNVKGIGPSKYAKIKDRICL